MLNLRSPTLASFFAVGLIFLFAGIAVSQTEEAARFEAASTKDVKALRTSTKLILTVLNKDANSVTIPRIAAPLRSMNWKNSKDKQSGDVQLKPGIESWSIEWKERPNNTTTLVLEFDAAPKLMSEVKPIKSSGDGSILLPAHLAMTTGEKVRYEPQPIKNTIGYWVGRDDAATWKFNLDEPGRFNVAILQGCGKGQGGSRVLLTVKNKEQNTDPKTLEFSVLETGHFQNFQWRQIGTLELDSGNNELVLRPKKIARNALMDVRAVHLIRVPK